MFDSLHFEILELEELGLTDEEIMGYISFFYYDPALLAEI